MALTVFRNDPGKLFALGYVVEGPSMLLLVLLLFLVRETTLTIAMLALIAALGMIAFLWQLIRRVQTPIWGAVQAAGLTFMLVVALYAAGWVAFYVPPLASVIWEQITGFFSSITYLFGNLRWEWRYIPMSILGMLVLIVTGTPGCPHAHRRAHSHRARLAQPCPRPGGANPLLQGCPDYAPPVGCMGRHLRLQPAPASGQSLCAAFHTARHARPGRIAAGPARNHPRRPAQRLPERLPLPLGGRRGPPHTRHLHVRAIPEPGTRESPPVQRAYEVLSGLCCTSPSIRSAGEIRDTFAFTTEPSEAAQLYEDFFDQPITDGEREAVVRAVRSTWSADQAEAAWRAVDDREVRLNRQEVTVSEHGDWAEIELYEVYQNVTSERQEVIYYFSLPESAAVTGVWLGNSPDRSLRFAYQVAPRGAAQASYRSELIRNVDPALIEQIGPRQYRLRVFPIDPINISTDFDGAKTTRTVHEGPELHLWLTYRTPAIDGAWPLPQLADKYNVFWDRTSERSIAGKAVRGNESDWLPASVPASGMVIHSEHRNLFRQRNHRHRPPR